MALAQPTQPVCPCRREAGGELGQSQWQEKGNTHGYDDVADADGQDSKGETSIDAVVFRVVDAVAAACQPAGPARPRPSYHRSLGDVAIL